MGMRVLSRVMLILYCAATLLQYNDPDLYIWDARLRLGGALVLDVLDGEETARTLGGVLALACLLAALYLGTALPEGTLNYRQEELSESGGLLVTAVWSLVLARRQRMAEKQRAAS